MDFSSTHMFVSNYTFTGVIKTSFVKDFHILKLKIEFYKILTNDKLLIERVMKSCLEDITSPNALKLVSTQLVYSKVMDFYEAEAFRNYLEFVNHRNQLEDQKIGQVWNIVFQFPNDINHFKILLSTSEVLRLYNIVNSFYSNYAILDAMLKMMSSGKIEEKKQIEEKKITEYIPTHNNQVQQPQVKIDEVVQERTEIDDIFELCLSGSIKSSLIHYTFSYFRFFDSNRCKLLTSNKGQVKVVCPILVPSKFNFDELYFQSLILSSSEHINSITYVIRKLFSLLLQNHSKYKGKPLYIMMINYLLFVYLLRYLYEVNRDSFREYFWKIICIPESQKNLFVNLIRSTFSEFQGKIFYEITPAEISNSENNLDEINKLSTSYKHLIPISQEDFADKIFLSINNKKENNVKILPNDFKINNKKVINIKSFFETSETHLNSSMLFDPEKTLNPSETIDGEYGLLNYKLEKSENGQKTISKAYKYLLNYIKNPSSLLLLKDNIIPKEVLNLFDLISKQILTIDEIKKENISTLSFYEKVVDKLPDPTVFKHLTILYIVFQIMIPYHFDMYQTTQFNDCFL